MNCLPKSNCVPIVMAYSIAILGIYKTKFSRWDRIYTEEDLMTICRLTISSGHATRMYCSMSDVKCIPDEKDARKILWGDLDQI